MLGDDEIRRGLVGMPSWQMADGQIATEFCFADFGRAIAFVVRVGFEAEHANHHPDIDIRYNRVRVALSTHSAGGVTTKDLDLATIIEGVADR